MKFLYAFFILTIVLVTSCKKDDPVIPNEEEVITTLQYTLTPVSTGVPATMLFRDLDGDGGMAPVITTTALKAHTTYTGLITLLNEHKSPSEDITVEIRDEDDEHQFFFQTDIAGLSIAYSDMDGDGNPIGLETTVTTGAAGSGTFTVTLRHEPNKGGTGVSGGDITNAGGETDIEVTFPVEVQ